MGSRESRRPGHGLLAKLGCPPSLGASLSLPPLLHQWHQGVSPYTHLCCPALGARGLWSSAATSDSGCSVLVPRATSVHACVPTCPRGKGREHLYGRMHGLLPVRQQRDDGMHRRARVYIHVCGRAGANGLGIHILGYALK